MKIKGMLLLVIVVVTSASLAMARPQKSELMVYRPGLINGVLVDKGTYKVEISPDLSTVKLSRAGKTVASAPCEVGVLPEGALGSSVLYEATSDAQEAITRIILYKPGVVIHLKEARA